MNGAAKNMGVVFIKSAVVYLLLGICLGIAMGASETFTLKDAHAHLNLLGWATMALAGLIYSVFPEAGTSKLAQVHFWLANLSLPVMMAALTLLLLGNKEIVPVLALSEIVMAAGILCMAINIFINIKPRVTQAQ